MTFTSPRLASLLAGDDDAPALHDGQRLFSRTDLRNGAEQAARGLQQLGLRRGDAVAVWLDQALPADLYARTSGNAAARCASQCPSACHTSPQCRTSPRSPRSSPSGPLPTRRAGPG